LAPLAQLLFWLAINQKAGAAYVLHFLAGSQLNEQQAPLAQLFCCRLIEPSMGTSCAASFCFVLLPTNHVIGWQQNKTKRSSARGTHCKQWALFPVFSLFCWGEQLAN